MKMYDYGSRIYCCDHPDRIDDMGKFCVGELPEGSPQWCPLRYGNDKNVNSDIIWMNISTDITDINGEPIEIKVPEPEYMDDPIF